MVAEKGRAGRHPEKDERERRQNPDRLADQDEAGDLGEEDGKNHQERGNSHLGACPSRYGTAVAPRKGSETRSLDLAGKVLTLREMTARPARRTSQAVSLSLA